MELTIVEIFSIFATRCKCRIHRISEFSICKWFHSLSDDEFSWYSISSWFVPCTFFSRFCSYLFVFCLFLFWSGQAWKVIPRNSFLFHTNTFVADWRMHRHVDNTKHWFWCSDFIQIFWLNFSLLLFSRSTDFSMRPRQCAPFIEMILAMWSNRHTNKFYVVRDVKIKKVHQFMQVMWQHLFEELVTAQCLVW